MHIYKKIKSEVNEEMMIILKTFILEIYIYHANAVWSSSSDKSIVTIIVLVNIHRVEKVFIQL